MARNEMVDPVPEVPDCPIFDLLAPWEREALLARLTHETVAPGQAVLTESRHDRGLWIIQRGHCQVIRRLPDGSERMLARLGSGAIVGEMSFFQPAPNSATVRAETEVTLYALTPAQYAELERDESQIAQKIAYAISLVLAERLRQMDDWIGRVLARGSADTHQEWSEFRARLFTNWDF